MAPRASESKAPKQKSLMSWLAKPATKPALKTNINASNSQNSRTESSPARSSDGGSSARETPPTSDAIDIDMSSVVDSDDDEDGAIKKRVKRKIVLVEDSDEDLDGDSSTTKKLSKYRKPAASPPSGAKRNVPAKKPRVSVVESDEEENEGLSSFTQKLSKFKKPLAKSSRSAASDDDDFIVPSDSDAEADSRSNASRLSHSSASSTDGEDSEPTTTTKSKHKKSRPELAKNSSSGAGKSFLTAAEQRELGKKNDKKATEDPYAFLLDLMDKDMRRPSDPKYDPRTLHIPSKAWADFTPFEKQFWEIKQNHYDTVLFFQKGKFLELYEEDARIGHREFDLKLTHRVKMSMVGVPEMSFSFWAAKFLGKGYKVGRVDQAETALGAEMRLAADKSKGKVSADKGKDKIVRRELNKVYTNGTLVDAELLTDDQAGHCISIHEHEGEFGICVLDSSTSQFNLSGFVDDVCRTKLETLMRQLRPKEVLMTKDNLMVPTVRLLKAVLPAACLWTPLREVEGFSFDQTLQELRKLYPSDDDAASMDEDALLGSNVPEPIREMLWCRSAIQSLGNMIWYLRQLNIDKNILSMRNFNVYDPMKRGQGLILDGQTLAHVEVLLNDEGTQGGTLLQLLGRCITPFGKRLFRIWLCMPLKEPADINARLDAVQEIIDHPTFEKDFGEVAKGLPDLERIISRVHAGNCKVKDFLKVLTSFKKLSRGMKNLANSSEAFETKVIFGLLRSAPDLLKYIQNVQALYKEPASDKDDELVPQDGKDDEYDEIMTEIESLEKELEADLKKFEREVGCALSYWHSAQGNKEIYLIQTKLNQEGLPGNWTKTGGTKQHARWLVPSLQKKVRSLKEARENRTTAIKRYKLRVYGEFDAERAMWLRAIRIFAELDCLFSLAKSSVAIGEPSCRPTFVEGDAAFVEFEELRHPALMNVNFIPNDVKLGGNVGKVALLTGPNMGGKSTVMRMTAAGVIMAQLGMHIPAKTASLCPVDSILTRMGAYDNMFSNASTFKVELDECCKILRDATPKSFVILDELGRGTSTYDGMAIAGAVLHQLATHTLPLCFFATHYGSLTDDFAYHPNIRNMHMSTLVDDENRELVFLYKLVEGVASGSFGTHVANLAGVPLEVVERADVVSKNFAQHFKQKLEDKQKKAATSRLPLVAQADFVYLFKLATGELSLPENAVRQKELLMRMKDTLRRCVQV